MEAIRSRWIHYDVIRLNLTRCTDAELGRIAVHIQTGIDTHLAALAGVQAELNSRNNVELPLGEVAIEGYAEIADSLVPPQS